MTDRHPYPLIASLALLVALAACSDELTSPGSLDSAKAEAVTAAKKVKMVPHKGEIFIYPTAVEPTDDSLVVRISFEGEGIASHFGSFTETGAYSLHSDGVGTPLFISDVVATRYTANGDQVFLTNVTGMISLTGDPEHPLILEGDFNYGGGTGRFEGVSGSLHWVAIGNPDGSALSNFEGTISTVGSGK